MWSWARLAGLAFEGRLLHATESDELADRERKAWPVKPFVIGIAGGTGSGKTTVAQRIASAVADADVALIEHDSY